MFGRKRRQQMDRGQLLRSLHGRAVETVTRRDPETYGETILGREGHINLTEEELIIVCGGQEVFRRPLKGLRGSELMSLDGIVLRALEKEADFGTVVAYYEYYRK